MKKRTFLQLFTPVSLFLISLSLRSQSNFSNGNISGITINSTAEALKFSASASGFTNLSTVELDGNIDSVALSKVIGQVAKLKIRKLSVTNSVSKFPTELLGQFHSLAQLEYHCCDENDFENLVTEVSGLPLKYISLRVSEQGLIPDNLGLLTQLDSVEILINESCTGLAEELSETSYFIPANDRKKIKVLVLDYDNSTTADQKQIIRHSFLMENVPETQNQFARKYKNVSPPVKGLDVPKEVFPVDAKNGGTFIYPESGTSIVIPPDAFVDAKGKKIKGEVNIDYREYRNPEEIFASGIPMTMNTPMENGVMESAGMFELNASQNGQEVFLGKGKKIELAVVPTDTLTKGYNFYTFNPEAGNWTNRGRIEGSADTAITKQKQSYPAANDSVELEDPSPATRVYRQYLSLHHKTFDTTRFAERFYSPEYDYTRSCKVQCQKIHLKKNRYKRVNNLVRIANVRKNRQGEILFSLRYLYKCHPELAAFAGLAWRAEGISSTTQFRSKFLSGRKYSDVRIEKSGDEFTIKLKQKGVFITLEASLVRLNEKDSVLVLRDGGSRKFVQYSRKLRSREKIFNRNVKLKRLPYNSWEGNFESNDVREIAYAKALKLMNAEEKLMAKELWMAKGFKIKTKVPSWLAVGRGANYLYDDRENRVRVGGVVAGVARGILSIASLGLFNFDRIYIAPPAPVVLSGLAVFKNQSGELVRAEQLYTVHRKGVVIRAEPKMELQLRKGSKVGFMIVTNEGNVAIAKYAPVTGLGSEKGNIIIEVEEIEEKGTNPHYLKKYLGF
jgi:hypothetical protein